MVPFAIGTLSIVTDKIETWINKSGIDCPVEMLRKGDHLKMARIIREVMNT